MTTEAVPRVTVVVPSHDRPARLAALLDALAAQTLPRERWEAVVVHDSPGETDAVLANHPLANAGVLRAVRFPAGSGSAAAMRNAGWRAARAPLIAFTDDDCRPAPTWLARLLDAAGAEPGAVVQGRTRPDPDEAPAPLPDRFIPGVFVFVHTLSVDPPSPQGETCNMLYPRTLLERLGGFCEAFRLPFGEDSDLVLRARRDGAGVEPAPDALVLHAVETLSLGDRVRATRRWSQLALVAKRNPEYRRGPDKPLGIFVSRRHALFLVALAGAAATPWRARLALAALPWLRFTVGLYRDVPPERGRLLLSGRFAVPRMVAARGLLDAAEVWWLACGSVRYRTLFL